MNFEDPPPPYGEDSADFSFEPRPPTLFPLFAVEPVVSDAALFGAPPPDRGGFKVGDVAAAAAGDRSRPNSLAAVMIAGGGGGGGNGPAAAGDFLLNELAFLDEDGEDDGEERHRFGTCGDEEVMLATGKTLNGVQKVQEAGPPGPAGLNDRESVYLDELVNDLLDEKAVAIIPDYETALPLASLIRPPVGQPSSGAPWQSHQFPPKPHQPLSRAPPASTSNYGPPPPPAAKMAAISAMLRSLNVEHEDLPPLVSRAVNGFVFSVRYPEGLVDFVSEGASESFLKDEGPAALLKCVQRSRGGAGPPLITLVHPSSRSRFAQIEQEANLASLVSSPLNNSSPGPGCNSSGPGRGQPSAARLRQPVQAFRCKFGFIPDFGPGCGDTPMVTAATPSGSAASDGSTEGLLLTELDVSYVIAIAPPLRGSSYCSTVGVFAASSPSSALPLLPFGPMTATILQRQKDGANYLNTLDTAGPGGLLSPSTSSSGSTPFCCDIYSGKLALFSTGVDPTSFQILKAEIIPHDHQRLHDRNRNIEGRKIDPGPGVVAIMGAFDLLHASVASRTDAMANKRLLDFCFGEDVEVLHEHFLQTLKQNSHTSKPYRMCNLVESNGVTRLCRVETKSSYIRPVMSSLGAAGSNKNTGKGFVHSVHSLILSKGEAKPDERPLLPSSSSSCSIIDQPPPAVVASPRLAFSLAASPATGADSNSGESRLSPTLSSILSSSPRVGAACNPAAARTLSTTVTQQQQQQTHQPSAKAMESASEKNLLLKQLLNSSSSYPRINNNENGGSSSICGGGSDASSASSELGGGGGSRILQLLNQENHAFMNRCGNRQGLAVKRSASDPLGGSPPLKQSDYLAATSSSASPPVSSCSSVVLSANPSLASLLSRPTLPSRAVPPPVPTKWHQEPKEKLPADVMRKFLPPHPAERAKGALNATSTRPPPPGAVAVIVTQSAACTTTTTTNTNNNHHPAFPMSIPCLPSSSSEASEGVEDPVLDAILDDVIDFQEKSPPLHHGQRGGASAAATLSLPSESQQHLIIKTTATTSASLPSSGPITLASILSAPPMAARDPSSCMVASTMAVGGPSGGGFLKYHLEQTQQQQQPFASAPFYPRASPSSSTSSSSTTSVQGPVPASSIIIHSAPSVARINELLQEVPPNVSIPNQINVASSSSAMTLPGVPDSTGRRSSLVGGASYVTGLPTIPVPPLPTTSGNQVVSVTSSMAGGAVTDLPMLSTVGNSVVGLGTQPGQRLQQHINGGGSNLLAQHLQRALVPNRQYSSDNMAGGTSVLVSAAAGNSGGEILVPLSSGSMGVINATQGLVADVTRVPSYVIATTGGGPPLQVLAQQQQQQQLQLQPHQSFQLPPSPVAASQFGNVQIQQQRLQQVPTIQHHQAQARRRASGPGSSGFSDNCLIVETGGGSRSLEEAHGVIPRPLAVGQDGGRRRQMSAGGALAGAQASNDPAAAGPDSSVRRPSLLQQLLSE